MRFCLLDAAMLTISVPAFAQPQAAVKTVSSEVFAGAPTDAVLIDVREPGEWAETGVPAGAKQVSISRDDFIDAVLAQVGGDRTKPVAVICKSGARSLRAAERLAAAGFSSVTNVGDGMMGRDGVGKGWIAAELPMQPYRTDE